MSSRSLTILLCMLALMPLTVRANDMKRTASDKTQTGSTEAVDPEPEAADTQDVQGAAQTFSNLRATNLNGMINAAMYSDFPTALAALPDGGYLWVPPGVFSFGVNQFVKSGVHIVCSGYKTTVLKFTGSSGAMFSFGDGTSGTVGSSIENCTLQHSGKTTGVAFRGSTSNLNFPSLRNVIRGNQILNVDKNNEGTGIAIQDSAWVTRIENNWIIGDRYPFDSTTKSSTENTILSGNDISCENAPGGIGVNLRSAGGPAQVLVDKNGIYNCSVGISAASNTGTYTITNNYLEFNTVDLACDGVSNGSGSVISGNLFGGDVGISHRSIQFSGCQGWQIGPNQHQGTYSLDVISLDAKSSYNTLSGYYPTWTRLAQAPGANNTFLGSNLELSSVGGSITAYRTGIPGQYIQMRDTSGDPQINASTAAGKVSLAVDNVDYAAVTPSGLAVTGTISSSGGYKIGGNSVLPSTLTGVHGNGVKVQISDGTGASGSAALYDDYGNLTGGGTKPTLSGTTSTIGGSILPSGGCASAKATIAGASSGMVCGATASDGSFVGGNFTIYAYGSGPDTATVQVCALSAGTPAAKSYNVRCIQ